MNNVLLQNLIELIARHTGLNIREQDKQALVNKVFARMQALKLNTPEQYYQLLDSSTKNGATLILANPEKSVGITLQQQ
jgi:chemotaxis protein methyltransferase CheR